MANLKMSYNEELVAEACVPDFSLLEFFQSNLSNLNKIHLKDVSFRVLDDVSIRLQGTMLRETDWMAFLNELGVVDNIVLVRLKFMAKWREECEIYLALTGPLMERLTFGDLVKVLINRKRHDALLDLKPYVERLLNEPKNYLWVPKIPTAPDDLECEKEQSQGNCPHEHNMNSRVPSLNINNILIKQEKIAILILHTDENLNVAQELRSRLREAGLSARLLRDFNHLLLLNSYEVIPALLSVVDFVVPIVSKSFLEQILSGKQIPKNASIEDLNNEDYFSDNSNNSYIYNLLRDEFVHHNKCQNLRVRPVMIPDFSGQLLRYNLLLRYPYKLWNELPDFIEMLKKTKKLFVRLTV